jgi:hypothetical protein
MEIQSGKGGDRKESACLGLVFGGYGSTGLSKKVAGNWGRFKYFLRFFYSYHFW